MEYKTYEYNGSHKYFNILIALKQYLIFTDIW